MARNDSSGETPLTGGDEWREIQLALQIAQVMARMAKDGLDSIRQPQIRQHVLRPPDPRLGRPLSPQQTNIESLLTTYFKLRMPDPLEVMNLQDAFHRIHQRLLGMGRESFRMVSHQVANDSSEPGGDTFGYVITGQNLIYLNETYFGGASPGGSTPGATNINSATTPGSGGRRGIVSVDPAGIRLVHSREKRASVILHETVHLCCGAAGAIHRALRAGEDVDTETISCRTGFPQISSYRAAIGDAYVYARFARCIYRSRSGRRNP